MSIEIITCPQWGARPPRSPIQHCGRATRIIFHHTAGHHAEIANPNDESVEEAKRYARDIQAFHMDTNGWIDSGHNFLVTRAGQILQGRWLTVAAVEAGQMVVSAHCPGQNTNIGIEHEHSGTEQPTAKQLHASALLQAWIAKSYGLKSALPVSPHRAFFPTACPGNLAVSIPEIVQAAQRLLERGQL